MNYEITQHDLKLMGFKEMDDWHGWEHAEHDITYLDGLSVPEWYLYGRQISPTSKSDIETLIKILSP